MRSSSERTIERRVSPQPQGYEANQRTKDEEEEEGKEKEEKRGEEEEEDRFSPSSSCALPPSIRWENVSSLTTPRTTDNSTEAGDSSPVDRKLEDTQGSPEHPVQKGRVHSSKVSGAAAEGAGEGVTADGMAGANEVEFGGEGGGLNERCKDVLRPATASSGGISFFAHDHTFRWACLRPAFGTNVCPSKLPIQQVSYFSSEKLANLRRCIILISFRSKKIGPTKKMIC